MCSADYDRRTQNVAKADICTEDGCAVELRMSPGLTVSALLRISKLIFWHQKKQLLILTKSAGLLMFKSAHYLLGLLRQGSVLRVFGRYFGARRLGWP